MYMYYMDNIKLIVVNQGCPQDFNSISTGIDCVAISHGKGEGVGSGCTTLTPKKNIIKEV